MVARLAVDSIAPLATFNARNHVLPARATTVAAATALKTTATGRCRNHSLTAGRIRRVSLARHRLISQTTTEQRDNDSQSNYKFIAGQNHQLNG